MVRTAIYHISLKRQLEMPNIGNEEVPDTGNPMGLPESGYWKCTGRSDAEYWNWRGAAAARQVPDTGKCEAPNTGRIMGSGPCGCGYEGVWSPTAHLRTCAVSQKGLVTRVFHSTPRSRSGAGRHAAPDYRKHDLSQRRPALPSKFQRKLPQSGQACSVAHRTRD